MATEHGSAAHGSAAHTCAALWYRQLCACTQGYGAGSHTWPPHYTEQHGGAPVGASPSVMGSDLHGHRDLGLPGHTWEQSCLACGVLSASGSTTAPVSTSSSLSLLQASKPWHQNPPRSNAHVQRALAAQQIPTAPACNSRAEGQVKAKCPMGDHSHMCCPCCWLFSRARVPPTLSRGCLSLCGSSGAASCAAHSSCTGVSACSHLSQSPTHLTWVLPHIFLFFVSACVCTAESQSHKPSWTLLRTPPGKLCWAKEISAK